MAVTCPNCSSPDTQTLIHHNQCLNCGKLFDFQGNVAERGLRGDPVGMRRAEQALLPPQTVVVGNLADLQRAGAEAAVSGSASLQGTLPPNTDPDSVVTPAQADAARGEVTRETERTGLSNGDEVTVSASTATSGTATKAKASTKKK